MPELSESVAKPCLSGAGDRGPASARVLVIGGGVSGCACAAVLAAGGVSVTVFNSSLDAVNQPAYGPLVEVKTGGWGRVAATLGSLPSPLREVWANCALAATSGLETTGLGAIEEGPGFFCVDARRLSVESKRVLERMPGLEFRQGLIVDLRVERRGGESVSAGRRGRDRTARGRDSSETLNHEWAVVVETAFGEVVSADIAVIAVGLNLGGRVELGEVVLPGGRYGETPGEGVMTALERLGAVLEEVSSYVGPRISGALGPRSSWSCGMEAKERECQYPGLKPAELWERQELWERHLGFEKRRGPIVGSGQCCEPHDPSLSGIGEEERWAGKGRSSVGKRWVTLAPLAEVLREAGLWPTESEPGEMADRPPDCPPSPYRALGTGRGQFALVAKEEILEKRATWEATSRENAHMTRSLEAEKPEKHFCTHNFGRELPLLVPDGSVTREFYCCSAGVAPVAENLGLVDCIETRPSHGVRGFVVRSLTSGGRLLTKDGQMFHVWVAGRAAGAGGYLESLASGAKVGADILTYLKSGKETCLGHPYTSGNRAGYDHG